jgi:osmotically-inducible protein OsmY
MIPRVFAVLVLIITAAVCQTNDRLLTDDGIHDRVRISLSGDREVKGGALGVDVKQGVVTLSGTVETSRQKDKAAKLAKKVKGVKQVINNIEVKKSVK